jgi:hypothetical protein
MLRRYKAVEEYWKEKSADGMGCHKYTSPLDLSCICH